MAVEPLFVADRSTLFTRIRLDITVTTYSTTAIVDRTMQQVRVNLYERLTAAKVTEILTTSSTENPTTAAELERTKAELVEQLWVEYLLKKYLPVHVYDAIVSTPPNQMWNKEPLTRDIDPDLWEENLKELWSEIEDLLEDLSETGSSYVNASTISPEEYDYPQAPGESMVPGGSAQPWYGFDQEDIRYQ